MNQILSQEQVNHFMNEAGNGESAQDIAIMQPIDTATEDTGGNVNMGDIGNDINTAMETAHLGLAGSKLVGSVLAKRAAGMTEDAVNPFYGSIANKMAKSIYTRVAQSNKSILSGEKLAFSNQRSGTFSNYGAQQGGIKVTEFRQMANKMGVSGNQLGKEMYISDMAMKLGGAIGKFAGIAGLGLGAGMTSST